MSSKLRVIAAASLLILASFIAPGLALAQAGQPGSQPGASPAAGSPAGGPTISAESDSTPSWQERIEEVVGPEVLEISKQVLLGLLLFIAGWILAKLLSWMVFRLLCKTSLDDQLATKLGLDMIVKEDPNNPHQLERFVAKVIYYLLMMLVVVGVLEFAGLSQAAAPIEGFVAKITEALPLIGKAALILIVAYFVGTILQKLVVRVIDGARLDERFAELSEPAEEDDKELEQRPFSHGAGRVVFWLIMVAGLAGAVDALHIGPLAHSMRNAIDQVVALLPALAIAGAILVAGYVFGRIARAVLDNLLDSAGFNRLMERLQMDKLFGTVRASAVVGWIAMAFIMLQAVIAALNELGLTTLSLPLTGMMARFWAFLPVLGVSVVIVVFGFLAGRILRGMVETGLDNLGFDERMARLGFGELEQREGRLTKPHHVVGLIVQVGVVLVALVQALDNVQLDTWSGYVNDFIQYAVTHAAVALIIVGVGLALGNYVRDVILMRRSDKEDETVGWIAAFSRYAVLVFAFTMAIHHLNVGPGFVLVAFSLLFGSLCLALALAMGLGGREVAGDIIKRQYDKTRTRLGSEKDPVESSDESAPESATES